MNTIILHGSLERDFGSEFKVEVRDPAEAFRALSSQLSGFREAWRHGEYHIIREMPNGQLALDENMLFLGMDNCRLHFMPAIEGSGQKGKGVAKTVLGVAMIGASFFIPGSSIVLGMAVRTAVGLTGLAMALSGISLLMAPQAKMNTGGGDDSSFLFNGSFNPSGQNFAVPVVVGKWRRKGIPIASELITNEYSVPQGLVYNNEYNGLGGGLGGILQERLDDYNEVTS
jgi:predicted phage tail protein